MYAERRGLSPDRAADGISLRADQRLRGSGCGRDRDEVGNRACLGRTSPSGGESTCEQCR